MDEFPSYINGDNYSELCVLRLCVLRKKITDILINKKYENFPVEIGFDERYYYDEDDTEEIKMIERLKIELENRNFICSVEKEVTPQSKYEQTYHMNYLKINVKKDNYE